MNMIALDARRPAGLAFVIDRLIAPLLRTGMLPYRLHKKLENRAGLSPERMLRAVFMEVTTPVCWGHLLGTVPLPADWSMA